MKWATQIVTTVLVVSIISLATVANAQDKRFVIGVEEINYYPLYRTTDGQYQGYARELLDAFAKANGYQFEYRPLPINRLYVSLFNGDIDFKFPDNKLWRADIKKEQQVHYSGAVIRYTDGVLVKSDASPLAQSDLKDLGTVRGFTPWIYLDDVKAGRIEITETNTLASLIKLLDAGRVDGVYFNTLVAQHFVKNELGSQIQLRFADELKHSSDAYHLSTLKHSDVTSQLNEFMASSSDVIKGLKKKYKIE